MSWLVPSENMPMAKNRWLRCIVRFQGTLGLFGVTDMEDRVEEVTVSCMVTEIPSKVAVMVTVPGATAVTRPVLVTVTNDVSDETQLAWVVISCSVPSE
jgi:hypothetical protein